MAEEYPFPIPKAIETEVFANVGSSTAPWKNLDNYWESKEDPDMFGYFNCWRCQAEDLLMNLHLMLGAAEPAQLSTEADKRSWAGLRGAEYALQASLSQFRSLLQWARLTWPYDPLVREGLKPAKDPEPSSPQGGEV